MTGQYDAFKQKRAEYARVSRVREKQSLAKLSAGQRMQALHQSRLMNRVRVQQYRKKRKQNAIKSEPYFTADEPTANQPDASSSNQYDTNYSVEAQAALVCQPTHNTGHLSTENVENTTQF